MIYRHSTCARRLSGQKLGPSWLCRQYPNLIKRHRPYQLRLTLMLAQTARTQDLSHCTLWTHAYPVADGSFETIPLANKFPFMELENLTTNFHVLQSPYCSEWQKSERHRSTPHWMHLARASLTSSHPTLPSWSRQFVVWSMQFSGRVALSDWGPIAYLLAVKRGFYCSPFAIA
jgi:hypothetical protein